MFGLDLNSPTVLVSTARLPDGDIETLTPHPSRTYPVAISLSENDIFTKVIAWDTHLSDEKISTDLIQHFKDFNQPLALDFKRVDNAHLKIMAAPLERIKQLCATVPDQFKIQAIDHESYAIARALQKTGMVTEKKFCFHYTENNLIKLSVFDENHLVFYDEFDHVEKINQHPLIENIKRVALENKSYLLALGLAVRENTDWNLHPSHTDKKNNPHGQGIVFLIKSILYAVLCCLIGYIGLIGLLFSQHMYNKFLVHDFQKTWAIAASVQTQKTQIKTMETEMQTVQQLKSKQQPSLLLLQSLAHAMPEGVFLMRLSLDGSHVELQGRAVTQEQTQTLMNNLKAVHSLENPVMGPAQPDTTEPPYQFSFSISATLRRSS